MAHQETLGRVDALAAEVADVLSVEGREVVAVGGSFLAASVVPLSGLALDLELVADLALGSATLERTRQLRVLLRGFDKLKSPVLLQVHPDQAVLILEPRLEHVHAGNNPFQGALLLPSGSHFCLRLRQRFLGLGFSRLRPTYAEAPCFHDIVQTLFFYHRLLFRLSLAREQIQDHFLLSLCVPFLNIFLPLLHAVIR